MNVLIDNKDLKVIYGIEVLDYTAAFGIAREREDEREWATKSGIDRNKENIRYDAREFVLKCICKASNEITAYNLAKVLSDYMFEKGVFVLSFRDSVKSIRECMLCERSKAISPTINVRQQNGLYYFKLGFKDINPNAIIYKTTIVASEVTIAYTKGIVSDIYWGNGDRSEASNSGNYTKDDYVADGLVDVIIDVDKDMPDIASLTAAFSADVTSGVKPMDVQFTDESIGDVVIWSWNFGDGHTSNEQSPQHTYEESGIFSVTLQVFNSAQGSATESKTNYITVRDARMLVNNSGDFALKNGGGDFGIIN